MDEQLQAIADSKQTARRCPKCEVGCVKLHRNYALIDKFAYSVECQPCEKVAFAPTAQEALDRWNRGDVSNGEEFVSDGGPIALAE